MSRFSIIMIVTDADRDEVNDYLETELGRGPNNLSVPLSGDGSEPATHWLCRDQEAHWLVDLLDAGEGPMGKIIWDARDCGPEDAPEHVADVLAAQGLMLVEATLENGS